MKSVYVVHPDTQFVSAPYRRANEGHYLVPDSDDPRIGDIVVVQVVEDSSSATLSAGKVRAVYERAHVEATRFYQVLISMQALRKRLEENTEMSERLDLRKRIVADLDALWVKAEPATRYGLLAADIPEADRLLRRLRETY